MKCQKITLSSFALVFLIASGARAGAVAPKSICIGDNNQKTSCFPGLALNLSPNYDWNTVTGNSFYNGNAKTTTYVSNGNNAATWWFKTPVTGEVWFSVYVPSTNATARIVYYFMSCGNNEQNVNRLKQLDQLYYSGWVTLGNVGTYPAGTTCTVSAAKYFTNAEIANGGNSASKMAIDAMKMTIY